MAGAYRGVPHTGEWKRARLDHVAAQMRRKNARVVRIRATLRQRAKAIDAADKVVREMQKRGAA